MSYPETIPETKLNLVHYESFQDHPDYRKLDETEISYLKEIEESLLENREASDRITIGGSYRNVLCGTAVGVRYLALKDRLRREKCRCIVVDSQTTLYLEPNVIAVNGIPVEELVEKLRGTKTKRDRNHPFLEEMLSFTKGTIRFETKMSVVATRERTPSGDWSSETCFQACNGSTLLCYRHPNVEWPVEGGMALIDRLANKQITWETASRDASRIGFTSDTLRGVGVEDLRMGDANLGKLGAFPYKPVLRWLKTSLKRNRSPEGILSVTSSEEIGFKLIGDSDFSTEWHFDDSSDSRKFSLRLVSLRTMLLFLSKLKRLRADDENELEVSLLEGSKSIMRFAVKGEPYFEFYMVAEKRSP